MSSERVHKWLVVAAAVFAAVAVAGVVGRLAVDRSSTRFTVEFRSAGLSCERDEDTLFLDATSGEELVCSAAPVATGTEEPSFRWDITGRAVALAQDGSLSDADQREVRRYADTVATEAGYDQSGMSGAELAPRIAMGVGCALALLCGAAALVLTFRQGRPVRPDAGLDTTDRRDGRRP
jgi:hypothetical protein